jgi:PIN domain nuclease of toxin-antitoxin system
LRETKTNFNAVADIHAAVLYLFDDPRLSVIAGEFIDQAAANGAAIAISPISLLEKKRLPAVTYSSLTNALADPNHVFKEAPFTSRIAEAMLQVPRDQVPDMPDRIVAATAIYLAVPAISRDGAIRTSRVQTVW